MITVSLPMWKIFPSVKVTFNNKVSALNFTGLFYFKNNLKRRFKASFNVLHKFNISSQTVLHV